MRNTVVIDCFSEAVGRYLHGYAVVAVDVVRATTTAITAAAAGRRCFLAATVDDALALTRHFKHALLAGEQHGIMPPGFHLNNSPAELIGRTDRERPLILLSSSGTRLCSEAGRCDAAYVACLRNHVATARHLARCFPAVAVIGAGSRGEFREEDQMCCAWLAQCLLDLGYQATNQDTLDIVGRWRDKPVDAWVANKSANYLRASGQLADLEFILEHVADLGTAFAISNGEVIPDLTCPELAGGD